MNDRFLNDLRRCLWAALLLTGSLGLRAQCPGPFNLVCQTPPDVALNNECQFLLTADFALDNLPACLVDSNFLIVVEDSQPENGPYTDGAGEFTYTIQGQNHPDLSGFSCSGTLRTVDATPPDIQLTALTVDRGCNLRSQADVNLLPADVANCWVVDGATGLPRPGSLDGRLRQALLAGGGVPVVSDACGGDVEVCVTDAFDYGPATACIDTIRLQRAFTARNLAGDPNFAPAFRAQNIRFIRPRIAQLRGVPEAIFISCPSGPNPVNPLPRASEYPFFNSNTGPIHVDEGFCELLVDYIDGERLSGCNGSYTVLRTFRVRDFCASGADTAFTQIVRVGDHQGPAITPPTQDLDFDGVPDEGPLRFTTNVDDCSATIDLRTGLTATEACAPSFTVEAFIYPGGDLTATPFGPYRLIGGFTVSVSDPLPIGEHLLRYTGRDACANTSLADVSVEVIDGSLPEAICEETFSVRLNGAGFAILPASALDAGSFDDCSPTLSLTAAALDAGGVPISPPDQQIRFTCDQTGMQPVLLIARDPYGNESSCTFNVEVIDDSAPNCTAPPSVSLNCEDFASQLPNDLEAAFAADPTGTANLLDAAFGAALSQDNCAPETIGQNITGGLNDCGVGQFLRSFTVTDAGGNEQTGACEQIINVLPFTEYSIRFPEDRNYDCANLPTATDLVGPASGCTLFSVDVARDTLDDAPDGSCFALRISYEVINWCEYDGLGDPFILPRDADGNGTPGDPLFLHVLANSPITDEDDQAVLDADNLPNNGNELGQLTADYGTSVRRGFFVYEQFVRVYDDTAPTLLTPAPEAGLAFTEDCLGGVLLNFTVTDDCGEVSTTVTIDELVVDRNDDDQFTAIDFAGEYEISNSRFEGEPATGVEVPVRNLPIGQHLARIASVDGCGNLTENYVLMQVEDGRAPAPLCVSVLPVELAADPVTGGTNIAYASDFVAGPAVTCTPTAISYALYREEEAGAAGFVPQADHESVVVDCADLGENILRLYAFAANTGRRGFCNVALIVNDNNDLCTDRNGRIDGLVHDEQGEAMRGAEIITTGPVTLTTFSDGAGMFNYDGLQESVGYEVRPYLNRNALNGLSTADLNVIGRRLMGFDDGLTPYQLIAADANNNGNITILDLLMVREVILGVEDGFDNNTSWRFVDAAYAFPDPTDPWLEEFPETVVIDDLQGNAFAEFIALKVGDVTGNANPQNNFGGPGTTEVASRSQGAQLTLRPTDELGVWGLYPPVHYQGPEASDSPVALRGAGERITAMQGTLWLPAGARILSGSLSTDAYHLDKDNLLHFSHVALGEELDDRQPLIRFQLVDGALPTLIRSQEALASEAYTEAYRTLSLGMDVLDAPLSPAATLGASPNPFGDQTTLSLNWPTAEPITLAVYDAAGRLVHQRGAYANAGMNNWTLRAEHIDHNSGLYFVRVTGISGTEQVEKIIKR